MTAVAVAERAFTQDDYQKYLPLVRRTAVWIARRVPRTIEVDDLVSYGWVGLMEAFRRRTPDMPEAEFEAYAAFRVRGAILDYLRSLDPTTRKLRTWSKRLAQTIASLTKELKRPPEEEEIAAALDMPIEEYRDGLERVRLAGMARLELLGPEELETASQVEGPEEAVGRMMLADAVTEAIGRLPERLQNVLSLLYQGGCTMKEVGAVLGVTQSRVCQLHSEAMHRLRADIGRT